MESPTGTASRITFRQIPAEEWHRLREVYRLNGDELPPAEHNTAIVAEVDGEIIGIGGLNLVAHAGPFWVAPNYREQGIATGIARALEELVERLGGRGFLMFPSNPEMCGVAEKLGLKKMDWSVYVREF